MSADTYQVAIVGVVGTLLGVLLGALLGYLSARLLARSAERDKAAMALKNAFKDELFDLSPAKHAMKEDIPALLKRGFKRHSIAVYDFAWFLAPREKEAFCETWYEYHCHEDNRGSSCIPFFEQYSCHGLTVDQEHNVKALVRRRIERILQFAEPRGGC